MTNVNLLPWREVKRAQEKKLFITILSLSLITTVVLVMLFNYGVSRLVDNQTNRNQRLKNEIILLDKRLKTIATLKKERLALITRMKVVGNLEATRSLTIHLFDEIIKIMPVGVVITKIERKGYAVTIWGYAESNANISDVMRNIENNQWIRNPVLTEIKKAAEAKQFMNNEFKLNFILKKTS